jgi:hypothetical protein
VGVDVRGLVAVNVAQKRTPVETSHDDFVMFISAFSHPGDAGASLAGLDSLVAAPIALRDGGCLGVNAAALRAIH